MTSRIRGSFLLVALATYVVVRSPELAVYVLSGWVTTEVVVLLSAHGRWGRAATGVLLATVVGLVVFAATTVWKNLGLIAEIEARGAFATMSGRMLPGPVDYMSLHTDSGDKELAAILELDGLQHLETFVATDSPITDRGLLLLARFEELDRVVVLRTRVTESGVIQLEESLPGCNVVFDAAE